MIWVISNPDGSVFQVDAPDPVRPPLDGSGVLATLLAVSGVLSVEDAANAVGLSPDDLVAEAEAWAVAGS
jgi:hypothetical protein